MPIHLDCPVCNQRIRVPNFAAGRITKCTGCGNAVRVPQPKTMLEDEAIEATKLVQGKPPEEFSPTEVWYRSIERLSGSLDWVAERPIRIVFAVLVLVACCAGVETTKWALSKSPEAPIVSVEPEDPEPWDDVGLTDAKDGVRVTAKSVTTEQIQVVPPNWSGARKTPKAYLRIALKIENLSQMELAYSGWATSGGSGENMAIIKDDTGGVHKQVAWTSRIVGQLASAKIPASGSVDDVLVFDTPGTYVKYLKLSLPAGACGGKGNLRIKIPRVRVLD
jgi:hypothetical protein